MKRVAFKMKIKEGAKDEYIKRHDKIWPELIKEFEDAGICDYSIYLDEETNTLFAFQRVKDHNTVDKLANSEILKKWKAYMADLMEINPDSPPKPALLTEVFHMD